jgi:predicted ATPase
MVNLEMPPEENEPHSVGAEARREATALSAGARFGAYEILSPLGKGGMGEVYRARDTRLGREVAIKVLPGEFSPTKQHLERFEREARAASALNHPNIVTIYELGREGSTHYIAMELVAGKTLREMLAAGPIPMRQIISIATQAADGLAKAHDAGIIHRDLKPENLMVVSQEGLVKILDFGVAKLARGEEECPEGSTSATSTTGPGAFLGTLEYMSPEQAEGRPVDFRSDQFTFGVMLYEMATGRRLFRKRTARETLLAILREEPEPLAAVSSEAPAPLCWLVERCLEKEPEKRYSSTRELARELAAIRGGFLEVQPQTAYAGRRAEARSSNLPVPRTAFVGREKEVSAAKELLQRAEVRLVTVTGPGGIGKTRLVVEVAREMAAQFPGGVYFVPLAGVTDAGLIASVVAQALGVRSAGGQAPLESLKEYLGRALHAPLLLCLDNFEHLVPGAATLADLLGTTPNLKILVTSRAVLHLYGEHEVPVPPLALPDARSLPSAATMAQSAAVKLFVERAQAVKPDFQLTEENAAAVAEICTRLDGLPLAIEIAAARIKLLSPAAMQARLASRLQLLTGGARDLPARQQTLRGAIDWSYDLLDAAEQKLFRRASVFAGGCTLEAAEAVCDTKSDLGLDLLEGMASMVDKSLMQRVERGGESRFVMLETIREYGLEKLAASREAALTRRAHAAYFLVLAEEGASEGSEAERAGQLDHFEIEHDNFRAALAWAVEAGEAEWGLRLGAALFGFWESREYLAEGSDWLRKLLRLEGAKAPSKVRGRVLFSAGALASQQGDYASATTLMRQALEIARQLGDQQGVAVALNGLAVQSREQGDTAASRAFLEESLSVWRELGDAEGEARALSNLANAAKEQGDYARALSLCEECLSIFRRLGDQTGIAWSLSCHGDLAREQGDIGSAKSLYQQSLAAFRGLRDEWGVASSLADLGNLALDQEDYATAQRLYGESMSVFGELGHKRGIARLLDCFARAAAAQGQAERALRLAGAAAALRQSIGASLIPVEQAKLDQCLEQARRALSGTAASTAWLEGWALPPEKAIEMAAPPVSQG